MIRICWNSLFHPTCSSGLTLFGWHHCSSAPFSAAILTLLYQEFLSNPVFQSNNLFYLSNSESIFQLSSVPFGMIAPPKWPFRTLLQSFWAPYSANYDPFKVHRYFLAIYSLLPLFTPFALWFYLNSFSPSLLQVLSFFQFLQILIVYFSILQELHSIFGLELRPL